jgi:hypothetical protein
MENTTITNNTSFESTSSRKSQKEYEDEITNLSNQVTVMKEEQKNNIKKIVFGLIALFITYNFVLPIIQPYCTDQNNNYFCKKCPSDAFCGYFNIKECNNNKQYNNGLCIKTTDSYKIALATQKILEKMAWE